jgi:hypothetical protein
LQFSDFEHRENMGLVEVYRYRVAIGMSSARKIDSIKKLRTVCSTASVFAVISESKELKSLLEEEINCVRRFSSSYMADNIRRLHDTVIPELKEESRAMLCDHWGESFVKKIEANVLTSSSS